MTQFLFYSKQMRRILLIIPISLLVICTLFGCTKKIEVSGKTITNPITEKRPIVNVYIETSGSMDGYMCAGSQLKDAVFDYISDLNVNGCSETIKLFYINSQIIPYNGTITKYIKTMDPSTFQKAGGNRANTDLSTMIDMILKKMNDSTVSIFISDCILDLPVANSQDFLNNCQISIKNSVNNCRKRISDLGVEIIRMTSDFDGRYYYPDGKVETLAGVKRPYYIWIFGNRNLLANLNKNVPLSDLSKYGLEESVSYAKVISVPYDIGNKGLISKIITPGRKGEYTVAINADFNATLQPDNVIRDLSNYQFNNPNLKTETVTTIIAKSSDYTHYIEFVIPKGVKIAAENLLFMPPNMPQWVSEVNDTSGQYIKKNLKKTTGIKNLIGGVADSYKNDIVSTNFEFTVKTK